MMRRMTGLNLWMLCLALLFFSCTEREKDTQYPVFGADTLEHVRMFERGSDALYRWLEDEIEGAVLVHVSAADALGTIAGPDMQRLRDMLDREGYEKLRYRRERVYGESDYLYAASGLGIVRTVYWVLPYRYFDDVIVMEGKVKEFLKELGTFDESDIDGMKREFGCLRGRLSGTDINICSPRTMHVIDDPVLLSIDAGFIPVYADGRGVSKLRAAKQLFDELTFRKLKVIRVDIAYHTDHGRTKTSHRYMGDELAEGIKDPQVFRAGSPPDLWKHRDLAENMLSGGEDAEVVKYLAEPLKKYPEDLPLKTLNALAHLKAGNIDESFRVLDDICREDVHYCYGFLEAGNVLAEEKEYEKAERFFRKALDALPGRPFVKDQYDSFLEESGIHITDD
jgi:hypothetical protein